MSFVEDKFLDFLFQMWAIQFPTAVAVNLILYLIFLLTNVNTLVDFGWTLNQMIFALSIMLQENDISLKYGIIIIVVFIWFFRLGGYIFFTRVLSATNDGRYEEMSNSESKCKRRCWFLFQFVFQAVLVIIPASPVYFMFKVSNYYSACFIVGLCVALIGIALEGVADQQLYLWVMKRSKLKATDLNNKLISKYNDKDPVIEIHESDGETSKIKTPSDNIYREGLWKKSRHPNLFFEFVIWVGFAIAGINDTISLVGLIGPFVLLLLMYFVTIPITERTMKKKRPNWDQYVKETNRISPIF